MTQLTIRETHESRTEIEYFNKLANQLETKSPEEAHRALFIAYIDLHRTVEKISSENKIMWNTIQQFGISLENDVVNVTDNEVDIREALLENIKIGQIFYPSDIANKYGFDLMSVMKVIQDLKEEGKFIESKTN